MGALVEVRSLVKHFPVRGGVLNRVIGRVHAVNDVSFQVQRGEVLGVVGESGCGKSTLGKCVIRLQEPTAGEVLYEGRPITGLSHSELMPYRRKMQIIFQDPYSSLNPRMTVRAILKEVLTFHRLASGAALEERIRSLIEKVGLRPEAADKFPHEFSGGQRQRIGIARALALDPEFLVADEPVSALDVSIQAQVLNLMMDLREEFGLTMLFVSHDLKVVEHFCDRVIVMYLGHIMEEIACEDLQERSIHPYTRALLGANPINDPDERRPLTVLEGDVPSPYDPPKGCPFAGRCSIASDRCRSEMPPLETRSDSWRVACFEV
ncbi:MAG TPA: ATP-binding cassette domain-containing protein [Planctomycetes bacterium]|nr:ATP-binding cassette domain-containing protein [Planctomycetota bacterium]